MNAQRQPYRRLEKRLTGKRRPHTTAEASARMGRVRRQGTAPELEVRRVASRLGLRYTLKNRDLPGSPDLANRRRKFAIFVHGCFWHRHPGCPRTTTPKNNRAFWEAKFDRNRARDSSVLQKLRVLGYRSIVIWECETQSDVIMRGRLRPLLKTYATRDPGR